MDMIHFSYSEKIQQIFAIAALLHDLGKATVGFQYKLRASESVAADPYRHGLIWFAHTEDVVSSTKQIYKLRDLSTDTEFHIVVYHARQLQLLRSQLKEKLDRILNRSDHNQLFSQPEIKEAIKDSHNSNHNKNQYRLANEFCRISLCSDCRWSFNPWFGFYKYKEKEEQSILY